jgi:pimeloyl-ACP methyl ester carboxylesterase
MDHRDRTYLSLDGLKLFYRDYPGDSSRTPVLIIPGIRRNAREHEALASHLATQRRVICCDPRGRGRSAFAPSAAAYTITNEIEDMVRLLAAASVPRAVLLGSSRGGIVAMGLASQPVAAAVILNDIGAELSAEGLHRHVGMIETEVYRDWDAATEALKATYGSEFVGLSEDRWRQWARAMHREQEGGVIADYDQKLGEAGRAGLTRAHPGAKVNLWLAFQNLKYLPTLVLRGENSDILSAETVVRMQQKKPDLVAVTVKGRGHAPLLDEPEALAAIDSFLARLA